MVSHAASWVSSMDSSGLWATLMSPGPQISVGMPAAANRPASVPYETLPGARRPARSRHRAAKAIGRRRQARVVNELLEGDGRLRRHRAHLGQKLVSA